MRLKTRPLFFITMDETFFAWKVPLAREVKKQRIRIFHIRLRENLLSITKNFIRFPYFISVAADAVSAFDFEQRDRRPLSVTS